MRRWLATSALPLQQRDKSVAPGSCHLHPLDLHVSLTGKMSKKSVTGRVVDLLEKNKEWLFSGAGITIVVTFLTIIGGVLAYLMKTNGKSERESSHPQPPSLAQNVTQTVILGSQGASGGPQTSLAETSAAPDRERVMLTTRILFIDDQTDFPVIKIIRQAGWKNVSIKKDVANFSTAEMKSVDIFFVDIQGVGKALGFSDEGLGLAKALKLHFGKNKKVIIYSAEPRGETFHDAWSATDGRLRKNAQPYEYLQMLDQLTGLANA